MCRQIEDELESQGEEAEEENTAFLPRTNGKQIKVLLIYKFFSSTAYMMHTTGPVIEEISEEEAQTFSAAMSDNKKQNKEEISQQASTVAEQQAPIFPDTAGFSQTIDSLKQNPAMMR